MTYRDEVLADSPVAYWRLGETSGSTTAADETGNGNDGTYNGPTLEADGALVNDDDTSADFDGSDDYVDMGDNTALEFASGESFSIEWWQKGTSTGSGGIVTKGYDGNNGKRPWYLSRQRAEAEFYLRDSDSNSSRVASSTAVDDGVYHHVVGVYDASVSELRLYVDGSLEDTVTSVPEDAYGANAESFILGRHSGNYYNGLLDEVAVYDKALSAIRVQAHYDAGTIAAATDVIGRFLLDGLTLATSGGTVPAKDFGDQWGQYAWGVDTWGTATDALDPVYADEVVGRLSLHGTVLDLLNPEALPLSDDAIEYVHLNLGVDLALDDDGVEYAYLNTGATLTLDDDGTEYVHLNTTVNAEAVVGRIRLSGGTGESIGVGYTLGSAVVNATAQAGDDALITWDETPTGTRLDFEVFRRTPSTGARFDPVADAKATESTLLDFETGDTSRWDTVNTLQAVTDRVHAGTYAGYSNEASSSAPLAATVPDGLAGGAQISKFEFWFQETSSGSTGGGVRLVNSNGDVELGLATDNPEWDIDDGNGVEADIKGDDNAYDRWVRFTVTFDWTNGTFAYDFEDPTSGTTRSGSGRPLKQGVDVETIQLENYHGGVWQPGNSVEMWWDDILVEYPGPDARIAQGIDALEYLDAGLDAGDYDWQVFARVERD